MGTYNRRVKFGLKIPNRLGKNVRKFRGDFLTRTVHPYVRLYVHTYVYIYDLSVCLYVFAAVLLRCRYEFKTLLRTSTTCIETPIISFLMNIQSVLLLMFSWIFSVYSCRIFSVYSCLCCHEYLVCILAWIFSAYYCLFSHKYYKKNQFVKRRKCKVTSRATSQ